MLQALWLSTWNLLGWLLDCNKQKELISPISPLLPRLTPKRCLEMTGFIWGLLWNRDCATAAPAKGGFSLFQFAHKGNEWLHLFCLWTTSSRDTQRFIGGQVPGSVENICSKSTGLDPEQMGTDAVRPWRNIQKRPSSSPSWTDSPG